MMRTIPISLKNLMPYARNRIAAWRRVRYFDNLKVVCYAPYPSEIYRSLLRRISCQPKVKILPMRPGLKIHGDKINLFVRHDIDTPRCMENLSLLVSIDQELDLRTGIYFRADGREYSLRAYRSLIQDYRGCGFEVGLHTMCYTQDDYLAEFERETAQFGDQLGFHPRSFTIHGLGKFRADVRDRFQGIIATRFREYGYEGADIPPLRVYDHTIHDCHLDQENRRFIYADFCSLPFFFRTGESYLLMTHPCYWQP